jgi:hypothetical protein
MEAMRRIDDLVAFLNAQSRVLLLHAIGLKRR